MSLRVVSYDRCKIRVVLEECPCGYEFEEGEARHVHLATHDPEDFGLSPKGETPESASQPLFGGEAVAE